MQRNPPGSGFARVHFTRGKNRGLRKFAVSGKLSVAKQIASGQPDYADPPLRRVLLFQGLGLAASRKKGRARGGFRAQRESAPGWAGEQPVRPSNGFISFQVHVAGTVTGLQSRITVTPALSGFFTILKRP